MLILNPPSGSVKKTAAAVTSRSGCVVFVSKAPATEHNDSIAEIPTTKPTEPITRHPEFCFDNTLIALQVEKTLFNVHKYQLAKSDVFSEMFKLPKPEGDEPEEGSLRKASFSLEGHPELLDLTHHLDYSLSSQFSNNQLAPEASLVIPAFRLANLLDFSDLRAYLLPLAEKILDDVDKIVFAREFDIKDWLAPAFIRLCQRETVLSTEEARNLDVDSVLLIWRMREQYRTRTSGRTPGSNTIYCEGCTGWQYYCHGARTCGQCLVKATAHYSIYNGPGKMGDTIDINEAVLQAEVEKWVEDNNATRAI